MANQNDPWFLHQYGSCDIHLATGTGAWEVPGPTYRFSEVLRSRGIAHHHDDWGSCLFNRSRSETAWLSAFLFPLLQSTIRDLQAQRSLALRKIILLTPRSKSRRQRFAR
jgi:hypothetical protein